MPKNLKRTSLADICLELGIPLNVTGYYEPIIYLFQDDSKENYETLLPQQAFRAVYCVNIEEFNADECYLRVLEQLAYGFKDYGARQVIRSKAFSLAFSREIENSPYFNE